MQLLQEILVPLLSVNDQSLTIAELSFSAGDAVKKGDVIAVLETSKTTYTVEAESDGFIAYFCTAGDDLPVNDVIAKIFDTRPAPAAITEAGIKPFQETTTSPQKKTQVVGKTIFSNKAAELIAERNLGKELFVGLDLVSVDDVLCKIDPQYQKTLAPIVEVPMKVLAKQTPEVVVDARAVKLSTNKLREIEYLNSVQSAGLVSIIHSHLEVEAVLPFLQANMHYFKDSLLPIILFETSKLLKKYPVFNAYHLSNTTVFYDQVNVGFAVDLDKGLKVVKIKDTNNRSIREIEEEIIRLSGAYIDDKLAIEDLMDVTFTITDLSNQNVAFFQPLVNMKNAAILGISSVDKKLSRCTLSLAFDHRVTEGKAAAIFLDELKTRVESFNSAFTEQQVQDTKLAAVVCHRCQKTLLEDDSPVGFAQCITASGKAGFICQACFKGF